MASADARAAASLAAADRCLTRAAEAMAARERPWDGAC